MIIKYEGTKADKLGSKNALRIEGTDVRTGKPWAKKIFIDQKNVSNVPLAEILEDVGAGEYLNVRMRQNGKFWNVVDVKEATEGELAQAKFGGDTKGYKPSGGTNSTGSTSSGWNGRTGEAYDRSAAIYLSADILRMSMSDAQLRKLGPDKCLSVMFGLADDINRYIHDGIVSQQNSGDGSDPLDPPEVD